MITPREISRVRAIHREGCLHEEVSARKAQFPTNSPPARWHPSHWTRCIVLLVPVVVVVVLVVVRRRCGGRGSGGASGRR